MLRIIRHPALIHFLAAGAIVLIPPLLLGQPVWRLEQTIKVSLSLTATLYLACALTLTLRRPTASPFPRLLAAFTAALIFAPAALLLLVVPSDAARQVVIGAVSLGFVLLVGAELLPRHRTIQAVMLALLVVVGGLAHPMLATEKLAGQRESVSFDNINSQLYLLRATYFTGWFGTPKAQGGAIATLGEDYLLATGDGSLFSFTPKPDAAGLNVRKLRFRVPLNTAEFAGDVQPHIKLHRFRVADILVDEREKVRLFASHHYWKHAPRCFVMRVSMITATRAELLAEAPEWTTLYETAPCLPIQKERGGGQFFAGIAAGGRLALLDEEHLLLTVGDHEFDGVGMPSIEAQDPKSSWGKTLLIDVPTGTAEIFSLGNRNAQGLYVQDPAHIWSTEHGPQGGDELNLISRGKNYGWPIVTYGVNYGTHTWPVSLTQGRHAGYEQPLYEWTPSIGVSNLVGLSSEPFSLWNGDLMVASLAAKSLVRITHDENRVIGMETLRVNRRIRDLLQDKTGKLVLWTDDAAIGIIEPEHKPLTGAALFDVMCSGCHAIHDGHVHRIGPDLHKVVGRPIAAAKDYSYSQALSQRSAKWTRRNLEAFLANPADFAPGTPMQISGIADPSAREKLIDYLKNYRPAPAAQANAD
jgi:cytochrome c2